MNITALTSPDLIFGINLKIKRPFKVRGNKHLFEINKKSYSGHTDSDRCPNSGPIRKQVQWVFMRMGREKNTATEERHFYWCR